MRASKSHSILAVGVERKQGLAAPALLDNLNTSFQSESDK